MVGTLIIGVMIIFAVFAPLIAPYDPLNQDLDHVLEPESAQHLMGTDDLGRDMLSRIMFGARLSLLAAIYAVGIGTGVSQSASATVTTTATVRRSLGKQVPVSVSAASPRKLDLSLRPPGPRYARPRPPLAPSRAG